MQRLLPPENSPPRNPNEEECGALSRRIDACKNSWVNMRAKFNVSWCIWEKGVLSEFYTKECILNFFIHKMHLLECIPFPRVKLPNAT